MVKSKTIEEVEPSTFHSVVQYLTTLLPRSGPQKVTFSFDLFCPWSQLKQTKMKQMDHENKLNKF